MPTYAYRCRSCGAEITIIRHIEDRNAPIWCTGKHEIDPRPTMERVPAAPAVSIPAEHRAA